MGGRVMLKFSEREEVKPVLGVVGAKDAEIRFNLLIGAFCLSIGLGVIGCGMLDIILEKSSEFPGKGGGELRASV